MTIKQWQPSDGIEALFMPKRTIGPSHYSVTGRVSSVKNGTGRAAESPLEQDFLTLLEFDDQVSRYGVQPITIHWKNADGKSQRYTPDVLVLYQTTSPHSIPLYPPTIFEVKPRDLLIRDWVKFRPKYKAAMAWSRSNGFRFKFVTDLQIRTPYLQNARFLLRYREKFVTKDEVLDSNRHVILRESLRTLGRATPRSLLQYVTEAPKLQLELIPMIWQMMHIGVITADLTQPLNMNTTIWLKRGDAL